MSKPLYVLRAERELACEKLSERLSWHCEREDIERALETYCCCGAGSSLAFGFIDDKIAQRDRRDRGELLVMWQEVIDAVRAVYDAERAEVAELISCGGRLA